MGTVFDVVDKYLLCLREETAFDWIKARKPDGI
jgi:hypothetical protein